MKRYSKLTLIFYNNRFADIFVVLMVLPVKLFLDYYIVDMCVCVYFELWARYDFRWLDDTVFLRRKAAAIWCLVVTMTRTLLVCLRHEY